MNRAFTRRGMESLPARFKRVVGSMRTQLIFWNVVALSLMLLLLGLVCRVVTLKVIMDSVDSEMARTIRMYKRPPRAGRDLEWIRIADQDLITLQAIPVGFHKTTHQTWAVPDQNNSPPNARLTA